jgi:hypothetical protein
VGGTYKIVAKIPLIVTFFVWSAVLGNILPMDNLGKKHIIVIDWYCMCKKSGKSMDYFMLHVRLPMLFGTLSLAM